MTASFRNGLCEGREGPDLRRHRPRRLMHAINLCRDGAGARKDFDKIAALDPFRDKIFWRLNDTDARERLVDQRSAIVEREHERKMHLKLPTTAIEEAPVPRTPREHREADASMVKEVLTVPRHATILKISRRRYSDEPAVIDPPRD